MIKLSVHLVVQVNGPVMAVHATEEEAREDWEIRTGRGARPDLERKYAVESWLVQDSRNLGPGECPYCNDPDHFRRVDLENGGHVHQLRRALS